MVPTRVYTEDNLPTTPELDYEKRVILDVPLLDVMGLHGALALCLKHPGIGSALRQ